MAIRRFVRAASVETGQQLVDVFLAGPAARQGRPLQQIEAVALLRPRRRRPGRPERLDQGLDLALDVLERPDDLADRSEEHTSELQSLMRISYAVFCLKKKKQKK